MLDCCMTPLLSPGVSSCHAAAASRVGAMGVYVLSDCRVHGVVLDTRASWDYIRLQDDSH